MTGTLTPFKDAKYIPVELALEQVRAYQPPHTEVLESMEEIRQMWKEFHIQELEDRYRLRNVNYDGGIYVVDWSKQLLLDKALHDQYTWLQFTQSPSWKLPSSQLVHATLLALYNNRENPNRVQKDLSRKVIDEIFLADFKENLPFTSTIVRYMPKGNDEIIHDYCYRTQNRIDTQMAGKEGLINEASGFEWKINALLGTRNLAEVEQVYEWLSGKKPFLWQMDQKPEAEALRAVVFAIMGDCFVIDANNNTDSNRWARGVMTQKIEGKTK
jgi:hypothetical protein